METLKEKNYYVVDEETNNILTGPLSQDSAWDYCLEHTNCIVIQIEEY